MLERIHALKLTPLDCVRACWNSLIKESKYNINCCQCAFYDHNYMAPGITSFGRGKLLRTAMHQYGNLIDCQDLHSGNIVLYANCKCS